MADYPIPELERPMAAEAVEGVNYYPSQQDMAAIFRLKKDTQPNTMENLGFPSDSELLPFRNEKKGLSAAPDGVGIDNPTKEKESKGEKTKCSAGDAAEGAPTTSEPADAASTTDASSRKKIAPGEQSKLIDAPLTAGIHQQSRMIDAAPAEAASEQTSRLRDGALPPDALIEQAAVSVTRSIVSDLGNSGSLNPETLEKIGQAFRLANITNGQEGVTALQMQIINALRENNIGVEFTPSPRGGTKLELFNANNELITSATLPVRFPGRGN